jgi:hypothetical protein
MTEPYMPKIKTGSRLETDAPQCRRCKSLRPGGNVTGITFLSTELGTKRLGLLHELRPGAARIAALSASEHSANLRKAVIASTIGTTIEGQWLPGRQAALTFWDQRPSALRLPAGAPCRP